MNENLQKVLSLFQAAFGESPVLVTRAPGRVEVLGNHTDYNEGYVLSFAIDCALFIAISNSQSGNIEIVSDSFDSQKISFDPLAITRSGNWTDYPLGVYTELIKANYSIAPFRLAVHGTIPSGAGLSSSAAFEVAVAIALCKMNGLTVAPSELAQLCRRAENHFVGTNCGLLDQYSSMFGKKNSVLYIDFRTLEHQCISLPDTELEVVVAVSGVSHSLVESAYNDRRKECFEASSYFATLDSSISTLRDISLSDLYAHKDNLRPDVFKRALHIVGENERVLNGISLLQSGKLNEFGSLLYASHQSSKDNFENSCPELDTLVELAANDKHVYGSRLTGGGFGGATISLLQKQDAPEYKEMIASRYFQKTGREARLFAAEIADGAGFFTKSWDYIQYSL